MPKFPVDAPKRKVTQALERLGFRVLREKEHISLIRENADGSKTPADEPVLGTFSFAWSPPRPNACEEDLKRD
jgi:hypothetical protein